MGMMRVVVAARKIPMNIARRRPICASTMPTGTSAIRVPMPAAATARLARLKETPNPLAKIGRIGMSIPCAKESRKVGT